MSDRTPTLWYLEISHYSEKARWALDHKGIEHRRRKVAVPGAHIPLALWLTGGRHMTLPVIQLDGRGIGDSTAIIAALEERFPEPPLYPADPDERSRALELEDFFDEELGPHMRRLAFHELGRDPALFAKLAAGIGPAQLARFGSVSGAYGRAFTALRYGARDIRSAEVARKKVGAALDHLETELGTNEYLVQGRFTVADLTAAALFYPLVMPAEGPLRVERMPEGFERFRARLRERRAYRWVAEMFARHRHATPTGAERDAEAAGAR